MITGGIYQEEKMYSISDKAWSLDTSRLDSLEEINHTLRLESLQLGVETDERPCPPHSVTERGLGKMWREGVKCSEYSGNVDRFIQA